MDEIGGKCFALWKITAPLDGAGILDETSQPITMAILHHFCIQQIAVTTFKCSALVIKRQRGLIVEWNLGEGFFPPLLLLLSAAKLHFPCIFNIAVITFV